MPFLAVLTKVDPDQSLFDLLDKFEAGNCESYSSKSVLEYYQKLYDEYTVAFDETAVNDADNEDGEPLNFDEWVEEQIDENGWDTITEGSNIPDEEATVVLMKDGVVSDIVEVVSDAKYDNYQVSSNPIFPSDMEDQTLNPIYLKSWKGKDACLEICNDIKATTDALWYNLGCTLSAEEILNKITHAYNTGGDYFGLIKRYFTPFTMILDLTGKEPRWIELSTSDDDTYHPMVEALEDYSGDIIITSVWCQ